MISEVHAFDPDRLRKQNKATRKVNRLNGSCAMERKWEQLHILTLPENESKNRKYVNKTAGSRRILTKCGLCITAINGMSCHRKLC